MASLKDLSDSNYNLRLLSLMTVGIIIAGLLTLFMYILIESSEQRLDESQRMQMLDFVRIKRDETSERKQRKPERPLTADTPPAPPTPKSNMSDDMGDALKISALPASTDADSLEFGSSFGTSDGEYLPIVKVAPIYPMSALRRGIVGACMVKYTVTPRGTVTDVSVIEEECKIIAFRKPSVDAALKFKYKPRVIDGEAISVPNVLNRFIFDLQDE
ncbi:MAG: TonB family protein [Gammaproteobacteria bacterium]|nr:TonB family protein [Gammaproteobacteria bacterium]